MRLQTLFMKLSMSDETWTIYSIFVCHFVDMRFKTMRVNL